MASITDVCNDGLDQIGQDPITNIDDGTPTANKCKRAFPILLRALLYDHRWNFNYTRVSIAEDAVAPISGFAHRYTVPADYLRIWRINGADKNIFTVEKGKILTDEVSPIDVEYGAYIDDPNKWPGMFTLAMGTYLASRLAGSVANDTKLGQAKLNEADFYLGNAKAIDGQEGTQESTEITTLTTDVRRG